MSASYVFNTVSSAVRDRKISLGDQSISLGAEGNEDFHTQNNEGLKDNM